MMTKAFLLIVLIFSSILCRAESDPYFLSSEKMVEEKQGSLKKLCSFVFFPLLKMEEKDAHKIIDMIDLELEKVALVVKKPVFTMEGADMSSFSNPILQFSIEQLVDQNNYPLPILQAILSISTGVKLNKSDEPASLNTNRWSIYLKKTNNVQDVVKKTLPDLLKQFIADFQRANSADQKPTFYICYDKSWWKNSNSVEN
ncbi:MAG: hypothetical protein WA347_06845 [Rhabdochlamydiaceae bacterium]|jgi:hypothetical protein